MNSLNLLCDIGLIFIINLQTINSAYSTEYYAIYFQYLTLILQLILKFYIIVNIFKWNFRIFILTHKANIKKLRKIGSFFISYANGKKIKQNFFLTYLLNFRKFN